MMRVEPSCGGWVVHNNAPAGESLVGWYKSEAAAHRALDAWRGDAGVLATLFAVMAHATAALAVQNTIQEVQW